MNLYAPAPYAERIVRLALGVEVRDAVLGGRAHAGIVVTVDDHPAPLHTWRRWGPQDQLDDLLPRLTPHGNGRFTRLLDATTPTTVRLRISDPSRRYVPRRFAIEVPSEDDVVAAETDPAVPDIGGPARIFRPLLHAGAAAETRGTVIRGRVTRDGRAVRWVRVQAADPAGGASIGWAHGDDRGEFVLTIPSNPDQVGFPEDPLPVVLTVGFAEPAPEPPVDDPLTIEVDPLWDLVEEPSGLSVTPLPDGTVADGRRFPDHFDTQTFPAVDLVLGRIRTLDLELP